jgi:hypothetical protein
MSWNRAVDAIINGIWHDLCDRSGYDLGCLDEDMQEEIRAAWRKIITEHIS